MDEKMIRGMWAGSSGEELQYQAGLIRTNIAMMADGGADASEIVEQAQLLAILDKLTEEYVEASLKKN